MFEAVVALCASLAGEVCRDQLIPGYEAETLEECQAGLVESAPDLSEIERLGQLGDVRCTTTGKTVDFTEVAPGVFVHMGVIAEPTPENLGDVSNFGFVIGETSVAVIDTGIAAWTGEAIWRAIRARTEKPISHVILTHMHPDHALGAGVLARSGAEVVGHPALARALSDRLSNYLESLDRLIGPAVMLGTTGVAVQQVVEEDLRIDLGARILTLQSWPTAHTGNDITVLDEVTGTLFAGDLVFHRHTPALDGHLVGWRAVLAELAEKPVARVVPGHGGPSLPWPEGATPIARYLGVLEEDTRAAIEAGQRMGQAVEEIAAGEAPHWELFEVHNPRNATVAFTELEWE